jgi:hypothetical protein
MAGQTWKVRFRDPKSFVVLDIYGVAVGIESAASQAAASYSRYTGCDRATAEKRLAGINKVEGHAVFFADAVVDPVGQPGLHLSE